VEINKEIKMYNEVLSKEFDKRLTEIEGLQQKFDDIFYKRNVIIKFFNFPRAVKLGSLIDGKIKELDIWMIEHL
jgi:hypothetical protein